MASQTSRHVPFQNCVSRSVCWCRLCRAHSSNTNEVSVAIAGSVCDVESSNATHIICVTNAQSRAQEAKVRVSIGDRGIAKMVIQTRAQSVGGATSDQTDDVWFVVLCRITQLSSTSTCGRPGSPGGACLHLSRARSSSSLRARPSCWTPAPPSSKCCSSKVGPGSHIPAVFGPLCFIQLFTLSFAKSSEELKHKLEELELSAKAPI